ncbi:MAG: PadR family transcriptional regulator [Peptostreptococcaceae bacterium]|nr:PadR family transcriptional regulator [Peptostreptococcaceae bacterium]
MTRLFVLGLLNAQPMSGYDIQQRLVQWEVSTWGEVLVGSIYHALKKLEQEGHIRISSVENAGRRQKAIYEITDQGRSHLSELIRQALAESSIAYPKTLYSGLTFAEMADDEKLRSSLEEQQKRLETEYQRTQEALAEKRKALNHEISPVMDLIFEDMLSVIRRRQEFVRQLISLFPK